MLATLWLAACPDTTVSETGAGGGGQAQGPTWGETDCGRCVTEACSYEQEACAADPDCAVSLSCLLECPATPEGTLDPECESGCPVPSSPTGVVTHEAFTACRLKGRGASCAPCGGEGGGHPILDQDCPASNDADACMRCEAEKCCETPCDAGCQQGIDCVQACNQDGPCIEQCWVDNPDAALSLGRWLSCMTVLCRSDCPGFVQTTACSECAFSSCPERFADCLADIDCYRRFMCGFFGCTELEMTCYDACDAKYPAGGLFDAFLLCVASHCAGDACPQEPPG